MGYGGEYDPEELRFVEVCLAHTFAPGALAKLILVLKLRRSQRAAPIVPGVWRDRAVAARLERPCDRGTTAAQLAL